MALKAHGPHPDAALAALIDKGAVRAERLDPDTVSDALFERAARRDRLEAYRRLLAPGRSRATIGGVTAEELMEDEDRKEAARLQRLGVTPVPLAEKAREAARLARRRAWAEAHPVTLKLPPFPPLDRKPGAWTGRDTLPALAGTQRRDGGYTARSSARPSAGGFAIIVPRPVDDDDANPTLPTKEQMAAYAYLKRHQADVVAVVLGALSREHASVRGLNRNGRKPGTAESVRRQVGLGILHVSPYAKAGHAYLGLEFGCEWDEEHGTGVLIHKGRVVAIGQADAAFDEHAVRRDGGTVITPLYAGPKRRAAGKPDAGRASRVKRAGRQ